MLVTNVRRGGGGSPIKPPDPPKPQDPQAIVFWDLQTDPDAYYITSSAIVQANGGYPPGKQGGSPADGKPYVIGSGAVREVNVDSVPKVINIYDRNSIGNGLTLRLINFPVKPDHLYKIEAGGKLGNSFGNIVHLRLQEQPVTFYVTEETESDGSFEISYIFTYAEVLELVRQGQGINLGGTASVTTMDINKLILTEITPGHEVFDIDNPYKNVEWGVYKQFKHAPHAHTTNSDGIATLLQTAEEHYRCGYNLVAITDHDFTTKSPNLTPDNPTGGGVIGGGGSLPRASLPDTRMAEMKSAVGRPAGESGMIFLPSTNEFSGPRGDALNSGTLSNTIDVQGNGVKIAWGSWSAETLASWGLKVANAGEGLLTVNHPGRNTGASRVATPPAETYAQAVTASNRTDFVNMLTTLFRTRRFYRAMEIINGIDNQSQGDRVLWDNILKILAPEGIRVLGDATDDSHALGSIGFSFEYVCLPELSLREVRYALQAGQYFCFSRRDREYGITPAGLNPEDNYAGGQDSVRELPTPLVRSIVVRRDKIEIEAENFQVIRWIADGVEIAQGNILDLAANQNVINGYVRAAICHSDYGVLYTQPFLIQRKGSERTRPKITAVRPISPVANVDAPLDIDTLGLQLPFGGSIETDTAGIVPVPIKWDISALDYDPNDSNDQTFTVTGVVRPIEVDNPDNIELTATVEVTVLGTDVPITYARSWVINPADRNVSKTGESNHVLVLSNIQPYTANPGTVTLRIQYGEGQTAGSSRRYRVWTDLSGNPPEIENFTFATTARTGDGTANLDRVVRRSTPVTTTAETSATVPIPGQLLWNGSRSANKIYLIITTDATDGTLVTNQRGGGSNNEFNKLGVVTLT